MMWRQGVGEEEGEGDKYKKRHLNERIIIKGREKQGKNRKRWRVENIKWKNKKCRKIDSLIDRLLKHIQGTGRQAGWQ